MVTRFTHSSLALGFRACQSNALGAIAGALLAGPTVHGRSERVASHTHCRASGATGRAGSSMCASRPTSCATSASTRPMVGTTLSCIDASRARANGKFPQSRGVCGQSISLLVCGVMSWGGCGGETVRAQSCVREYLVGALTPLTRLGWDENQRDQLRCNADLNRRQMYGGLDRG